MYDPNGNHYTMDGGGAWMVGFAILTTVLLLTAVLAILAHLYQHRSHGHLATHHPAGAVPGGPVVPADSRLVLDSRLAHGEVTIEEYWAVRSLIDER